MEVAPKLILFSRSTSKGLSGFSFDVSDALQSVNITSFRRYPKISFDISLERYGIVDKRATGDLIHFVDSQGCFKVSILVVDSYDPPFSACAMNEILTFIIRENGLIIPVIVFPFMMEKSAFNWEMKKHLGDNQKAALYAANIGLETESTTAMIAGIQNLPPTQIRSENLSCLLQLIRVLKLPTVLLTGTSGSSQGRTTKEQELEVLSLMEPVLVSHVGLCFSKNDLILPELNITPRSSVSEEPWQALYG